MGKRALRGRENWQQKGGAQAGKAEHRFEEVFRGAFRNTTFSVVSKPTELRNIYSEVKLPDQVIDDIYTPEGESWTHGVIPDFAIRNSATGKTLYVEVKRQDGWVEGKERKAGRGNAHERSCKFFTPGLLKVLRASSKIPEPDLPFWTVFQGDIARDPKRVREIHLWYQKYEKHFFLWSDRKTHEAVVDHFNKNLKKLLL